MLSLLVVVGLMLGLSANAMADYAAIAAGDGGFGWVSAGYGSMESARNAAKAACRNAGFGSCESSVAERSNWYYSGGICDGRTYVGTSPQGYWRSDEIVRLKAAADGYFNCRIQVRF
jgi:hypothetical protein